MKLMKQSARTYTNNDIINVQLPYISLKNDKSNRQSVKRKYRVVKLDKSSIDENASIPEESHLNSTKKSKQLANIDKV